MLSPQNANAMTAHPGEDTQKPPPIIVSAGGIAPKTSDDTPAPDPVDWGALVMHPPFQMFIEEQRPPSTRGDDFNSADYAAHVLQRSASDQLLQAYQHWHAAKGYWPDETPFGEVKE